MDSEILVHVLRRFPVNVDWFFQRNFGGDRVIGINVVGRLVERTA